MNEDEWLTKQVTKAREEFENADSPAMSYQYAAEAETYHRIKTDSLVFGTPEESLRVYEKDDSADYGMSAARIRAIERYLERFGDIKR